MFTTLLVFFASNVVKFSSNVVKISNNVVTISSNVFYFQVMHDIKCTIFLSTLAFLLQRSLLISYIDPLLLELSTSRKQYGVLSFCPCFDQDRDHKNRVKSMNVPSIIFVISLSA